AFTATAGTVNVRADVVSCAVGGAAGMVFDTVTDDIYAVYGRDTDGVAKDSLEIFYKKSTDDMVTWGAETAYGTVEGDHTMIFADPLPNGVLMPGYLHHSAGDIYVDAAVGLSAGAGGGSQEDNPFD